MAEFKWTASQRKAIYEENKNILVSAAAGSGKTAVLVERVLRKVLDPSNPQEIDSFVIITFTRAAAAQMREKIRKGLNKALLNDPENAHIKRQLIKLNTARISTIDSLCLEIVRENFNGADMDPDFKMVSEEESEIIKKNILDEILEENYASVKRDGSKEAFIAFVNNYIGRDDKKIEDLIKTLYKFALKDAEPYRWMDESIRVYETAEDLGSGQDLPLLIWDYFKEYVIGQLRGIEETAQKGLALSMSAGGPQKYTEIFENYIDMAQSMEAGLVNNEVPFSRLKEELEIVIDYTSPRYSAKIMEKEGVDPELKTEAKDYMDACKSAVKDNLLSRFFFQDMEDNYKDLSSCAYVARTLIDITKEFARRFEEEKKKRAIADFSDVSHAALRVLIRHDEKGNIIRDGEGNPLYTDTADSMAMEISEIIVDEYQDTNMLQEYIINALSAERFGRPDVFMVGDMKQSIYRFRFAVPSLFTDKYERYKKGGKNCRIILGNNFRSRPEILNFCNYIFNKIMTRSTGDIDYSDGNELIPSPAYEEDPPKDSLLPEIYVVKGQKAKTKKAEALILALKIEELAKTGKYSFGDIAVLSAKADFAAAEQAMDALGIPHKSASSKGFFDTFEISLLINLLKIIDNPHQDIAFDAVLRSPLVGFTAQDLALMQKNLFASPEKKEDLRVFMDRLGRYAEESLYMGVYDLTEHVCEDSGLYDIFAAMPNGSQRLANLDIFLGMALTFEKNGNCGLFNFLRYIENLKKSGYDRGLADASDEEDAVKMMTIHKSKGLEFPVVFLINTGGLYNEDDAKGDIVLDRDLGLGVDVRDTQKRIKKDTIAKNITSAKIRNESRGEQMRVLYVALTRAKERLFIVGSSRSGALREAMPPGAMDILGCSSHLSLILKSLGDDYEKYCVLREFSPEEVFEREAVQAEEKENLRQKLLEAAGRGETRAIEERMQYEYPYKEAVKMPFKISPSKLKEMEEGREGSEEPALRLNVNAEGEVASSALKAGALRGTAYHRFFEILDYEKAFEGAQNMIQKAVEAGSLKKEEAELLEPSKIDTFLKSPLALRMQNAYKAGTLKREQPYVMGVENSGEMQLVQGIIDAFFEEEGEIVLVDYKTDRGKGPAQFIETYKAQLGAYAEALEKAQGKPVKEKIIYSVELGREILL